MQNADRPFAGNALEAVQEFVERFAAFDIFSQVLDRHAGAVKARCAADPLRIHPDQSVKWMIRGG